jgi:hypothetical protein
MLVTFYGLGNRFQDAERLLQQINSTPEFANKYAIRVCIAATDLWLIRDEPDRALHVLEQRLKGIDPNGASANIHSGGMPARLKPLTAAEVVQLKRKQAGIYLDYKKDKRLYAKCYQDLVNSEPENANHYLVLGDA